MPHPLFINFKSDFLSRIRSEAGPHALITPSMNQALHWIRNPELAISAIYLNPNDSSASTLQFLQSTLQIRPVTRIFLIDDENTPKSDDEISLFQSAHIHKTFSGTESYLQFLETLQTTQPRNLEALARTPPRTEHVGFIAVPLIDFIQNHHYPFDVFVENPNKQLCLFATSGSEIDPEYLHQLALATSWLYIPESAIEAIQQSLKDTESSYMNLEHFPLSWKTAETLYRAKQLLNSLKTGGLSDQMAVEAHHLLGNLFLLVSQVSNQARLDTFIDQAKQCDRTIACATLSILMCKTLKFEKKAILEILGLASLFQDVSLYHSPFGNLAESNSKDLSATARTYYLQHPNMSADLVARHTSIPSVTHQVIRQHHERKDRTGFPNRIGGLHLHPMAEVLSLINAYLDQNSSEALDANLLEHYSEPLVHAFKDLLFVLEHQISDTLKPQ